MSTPPADGVDSRRAWGMVAVAGALNGISFGALVSVTVFLVPIEQTFGWDRSETSLAYLLANLWAGAIGVPAGWLADRYGSRPLALGGTMLLGLAFLLLCHMQQLWQFYLFFGFLLGGLALGSFLAPLVTGLGFWFVKHRGLAISLCMTGQTAGAAVVPLLATLLIGWAGWRETYLVLGWLTWLVGIPLALIWCEAPGAVERRASVTMHTVEETTPLRIRPRWLVSVLCMAIVGCCICMTIPLIHLVPLVEELGYRPAQATAVLTTLIVGSVLGRIVFGRMMDQIGGLRTLLITSGLQTVSIFWLTQYESLAMLHLFAAIFGFGYGGVLPCYPLIINELLPPRYVGRSVGAVFFAGYAAMGGGGYLAGLLYTATGDYALAYAMGAAAGVVNLVIVGGFLLYLRWRSLPPSPVLDPATAV